MSAILLVDDNASNLDTLESVFAFESYDIYYASSGPHALELLENTAIDVVLLDVMMPGMDGLEVCRRIKENPKWTGIPVIMVTALDSKEDMAFCLQSGADDFIGKPAHALELRARVRSMLRIKKQYDTDQEMLKVRQDLSNMIIHDLRNPLASIILSTEVLKRTPLNEQQKHKIEQIYNNGKRSISLIDSLLLIAKLEANCLLIEVQEVDLGDMINRVVEEFEFIADNYGLKLLVELPPKKQLTPVDKNLFQRIFDNLLSNAIKFSEAGQKIIVRLEYPVDQQVRVSVLDQGCGIQDDLKEIIFNQFEIGKLFKEVEQTGLGLTFCKLAVEAHGGQIRVEDNVPHGSIFIVEI
ncbi:MAG: response regulator [Snowella sp.]|nr:response regulator [Snowella sp.]